jgi:hypothetical protein
VGDSPATSKENQKINGKNAKKNRRNGFGSAQAGFAMVA